MLPCVVGRSVRIFLWYPRYKYGKFALPEADYKSTRNKALPLDAAHVIENENKTLSPHHGDDRWEASESSLCQLCFTPRTQPVLLSHEERRGR